MNDCPLTALEQQLRMRYLSRPDIQGRILSPQELTEYLAWLVQTKAVGTAITPVSENFADLAGQLARTAADKAALRAISAAYENQREDRYLLAGTDIAVGRMFRYMPAHWHTNEYFEVYYCFSGSCPIHLDNEVLLLQHGSALILAPNVRHASPCYADDAVLNYYMLRSSTFDKVFWNQLPADSLMSSFFRQALGHTKHPSYLHFETGGDRVLEDILANIDRERQAPERYSSQYLNLLMSEFFLLMFRRYEGTARLPRTGSFFWKHEFSAIFSYIQAHFAQTTQAEIAAEFGYSERQLNRIVKDCTGQTYAHLMLRLRMERAAQLLVKGAPIDQTAEACGYATLSSFYNAFTRYHGCTPAAYRRGRTQPD